MAELNFTFWQLISVRLRCACWWLGIGSIYFYFIGQQYNTVITLFLPCTGGAIKCYQCSTDEDPKGKDLCGAYEPFDETAHIPVDCLQEESVTPGTFCVKITKQSPRMFICESLFILVLVLLFRYGLSLLYNGSFCDSSLLWKSAFNYLCCLHDPFGMLLSYA